MRLAALTLALLLLLMTACAQAQPADTAAPSPSPTSLPATAVVQSEPTPTPTRTAPPAATPPSSPTSIATDAQTTAPTPEETSTPTSEPVSAYSRILEGVAGVRELGPTQPVVPQFMTREELSATLVEDLDEDLEDILKAQEVYKILDLIPRDADLRQLLLELYTEQIAGFYDSETEELYLITGAEEEGLSSLDEITLAHEFTHAIQQQRFDIQAMLEAVEDNSDASSALVALVEGDASAAQFRYMFARFTLEQQMEVLTGSGNADTSAIDSAPHVLRQSLVFPYVQGSAFVGALLLASSDWDAVNEAYNDPPTSTEQVIHPEKYIDREAPVPVSLPNVAAALGEGWENVYSDVMGEFLLKTYLETRATAMTAANAAAGWGGDRFALLRGPGDEYALVALLVWDTGKDAREFFDAMAASDSVPSNGFLGFKENRMLWVLSPSGELTELIRSHWPEF